MSCVLTVYSKSAYKEFLLPAVLNANHSIMLDHSLFHLADDISLELENTGGEWKVLPNAAFSLTYTDSKKDAVLCTLRDKDIFSLTQSDGERMTLIVKIGSGIFPVFDKYCLDDGADISIGSGGENEVCYDFMHTVTRVHAVIRRQGPECLILDKSVNGLFVNAERVTGSRRLSYGDLINVFGLSLVYLGDALAVEGAVEPLRVQRLKPYIAEPAAPSEQEESLFTIRRSPRYLPKMAEDTVKIEAPPEQKEQDRQPAILTIGPSLTMVLPMLLGTLLTVYASSASGAAMGVYMYSGLVMAVGSAALGAFWAVMNIRSAKKQLREDRMRRFEVYGEYLIACTNQVKERYQRNTGILRELYPDAASCCGYNETEARLWTRNRGHADFLKHRLGIGDEPFQVKIEVPPERFTMVNDTMADKAKLVKESYAMLKDVPVCADLGRKLVGIIGGDGKTGCYPIVHDLVAQLAANNCYTDVKLAFVYDKKTRSDEENWEFTRWLPHVWSEDKRARYVADTAADATDVFYEIAKVLRERAEVDRPDAPAFFPHYVIFIEDASVLEGELIASYLLSPRNLGVTAVLLAESYEDLPNACEYIIENTKQFQGVYEVTDAVEDRRKVAFDKVGAAEIEAFARRLSRIRVVENESGGELPASLSFFDMYGVHSLQALDVETRWRKNRTYDNIKGLLGQKAGGAACYLDVHEKYHGPHGLIAGTTGSGKSETLQTYMLSLAVNYSPDDVGFFVIDYKGGGMANLFSDLPHLIGQISNLSGNQVHRAMISIKSENLRRQRVFNEHGVNNINNYTRLYKNGEAAMPVPHMFIIIDEFAELKREEPEFMKELISVAQVGRSLGVHLILATQKPSGTVDDNIWSNSKFRLCLRVQDQQDSKDMLHRPDAAYITQAGRCYLQVGNDEIFELFQSGWSGAAYEEDDSGSAENIATMISVMGKAAVVGSYSKIKRKEQEKRQWIATLLALLDAAAAQVGPEAQENDGIRNVSEAFFRLAEERQLDYPASEYNAQRIRDLLGLYLQVRQRSDSGAEARAAAVIALAEEKRVKLPELKKKTQLEAVVEYLAAEAKRGGYDHDLQLWLPVLPETLYLEQLEGYHQNVFADGTWPKPGKQWELEAMVGLCDDPVNQAQMPLKVDIASNGSLAVVGTVLTGKSTFLLTLLYALICRYSPRDLNIYAVDYSSKMLSAIENAAQVGGVLYENDEEKLTKLMTMLGSILEHRKHLFRGGGFRQYVQAERAAGRDGVPAIILAIDNYSAFNTKTNSAYEDFILKLSKEGANCGIFLLVSAMGFSLSEIPNRLADNLRSVICMEMTDSYGYMDALRTVHLDVFPEENVKGRGLARVGDSYLEFQAALPMEAEDDFTRIKLIQERIGQMNACCVDHRARRIPEIPEKPEWKEFETLEEAADMWAQGDLLPIGYSDTDASVYGVDLRRNYCYLVSGKQRTGKTNALRIMGLSAAHMGAELVIFDFAGELKPLAEQTGARLISDDEGFYDYCLNTLQPQFIERNGFKWERLNAGDSDEELYAAMGRYPKLMMLIGSLPDFVQHACEPGEGLEPMAPFLENLMDKGAGHNVFWFACMNQDETSRVTGRALYELFISSGAGIHFGGNVGAQHALDFEYVRYNERSKTLKPGIGMLPQRDEERATKVVVPMYRK